MIHVSFAMTAGAYRDRSKTETRRKWKPSHAAKFTPGRVFMGITKDYRAGGMAMHAARVVFCHLEKLGDISDESFVREGGTRYWADKQEYVEAMGNNPEDEVWVLRFEHLP
jgi:hypothetical protein